MTAAEKIKRDQLIVRQKLLYSRIKEADKTSFEEMTATEQRRYDQNYGECVGIEKALSLFGIPFKALMKANIKSVTKIRPGHKPGR